MTKPDFNNELILQWLSYFSQHSELDLGTLKILDITRDLHADPEANALNIETEYEAKYSGFGEKIKRVVIGRR